LQAVEIWTDPFARMSGGTPVGSVRRFVHKLKILGVESWRAKSPE
jgi:hypothetical protein